MIETWYYILSVLGIAIIGLLTGIPIGMFLLTRKETDEK